MCWIPRGDLWHAAFVPQRTVSVKRKEGMAVHWAHVFTQITGRLWYEFNNRGKMAEVLWISHGTVVYYVTTGYLIILNSREAIFISFSSCVVETTHIFPSVMLSCLYSTQSHQFSVFIFVYDEWFSLSCSPSCPKSISAAVQQFIKDHTHMQLFPDAPKQWLHS